MSAASDHDGTARVGVGGARRGRTRYAGWMIRGGYIGALVFLAACSNVREVRRTPSGESVFETSCSAIGDCVTTARSKCSHGYELLGSAGHEDDCTMTFRCGGGSLPPACSGRSGPSSGDVALEIVAGALIGLGSVSQQRPRQPPPVDSFESDAPSLAPSPPMPAPTPSPYAPPLAPEPRSCSSDISCGVGYYCVKPPMQFTGTCAQVVDRAGVPTFAPPRNDSLGPGKARCMFITDCPVGFRCERGHCMK